MDRIIDLPAIVQQEVAWYASAHDWKGKSYSLEDDRHKMYAAVFVPDEDHPMKRPSITVMARIVGDKVVIDEDKTDRPLYEALMHAGIPREQIVVAYAGETLAIEAEDQ